MGQMQRWATICQLLLEETRHHPVPVSFSNMFTSLSLCWPRTAALPLFLFPKHSKYFFSIHSLHAWLFPPTWSQLKYHLLLEGFPESPTPVPTFSLPVPCSFPSWHLASFVIIYVFDVSPLTIFRTRPRWRMRPRLCCSPFHNQQLPSCPVHSGCLIHIYWINTFHFFEPLFPHL